ncbi:MAG: pilus assembly protein N-terminal domain-containing protein [Pseudomonadota bacterium]
MLDFFKIARRTLAAVGASALIGAGALVAFPSGASATDLMVTYDQSKLLRMPRPVSDIIIGNPSIADVTVKGANLLIITGKSFGITNIIALDDEKNVIQDQRIIVQRDQQTIVNLNKGDSRRSYNCSPSCNPTITVGDDVVFLDTVAKMAQRKRLLSEGGAAGGQAGGS